MPIKVLDKEVISRIAAGEVVERPASVVKELIENSLDAGSSQVSVEVRGGGVSLIRVVDDGTGIPSGEVELAFQRYATSKVDGIGDLETISTLGFRGEALPSIAAVAQVEVVTCADGEDAGTRVSLVDGAVAGRRNQGRSRGTTVAVSNLFRQVPARLKFLKSPTTENARIADVVTQYALAFPEVRFVLIVDGRQALRTAGSGRLMDSVVEVYGAEVARNMLRVGSDWQWDGGTGASPEVTGLAGSPAVGRSSRDGLSFFVNRRWINSRLLAWAVEEAYRGLLPQGKHPVAVINISVPPEEVDVNIHPAKTEVRFRQEKAVFSAVQKAVRRALLQQMPVPGIEEVVAPFISLGSEQALAVPVRSQGNLASSPAASFQTPLASLPVLRVLGQFLSTYIVAEGPDGLYLVDQHAAHERVLFEDVRRRRARREIEVQGLLQPAAVDVDPRQVEALRCYHDDLAEFGFTIEPFGDRTYLVRTVPGLLYDRDWMAALKEMLDSPPGEDRGEWLEAIARSIACHSAVRAGQALTDDEMRGLVRQLEQAEVPHTCPHGRPTMLHLSSGQLRREFGRT